MTPLKVHSHNHIHMIPYIFDIFIEICLKHDIKNIRTTNEFFDLSFPKKNLFILLLNLFNIVQSYREKIEEILKSFVYKFCVRISLYSFKEITIFLSQAKGYIIKFSRSVDCIIPEK